MFGTYEDGTRFQPTSGQPPALLPAVPEPKNNHADDFDEDLVDQIQADLVPKALRFKSPGRKANLSIFLEGKRQRKAPARFVAKN